MKYVIFLSALLAGCAAQVPYQPSPLAQLCETTDFSNHTDQELRQCRAYHGYPRTGIATETPRKSPSTITCVDIGNGLINCPDNGNVTIQLLR